MNALQVFGQNDGDVTKRYYSEMNSRGPAGQLAVALFRASKRSARAKEYRRGKWRRAAYDVKSWSLGEICRVLREQPELIPSVVSAYGWKQDPAVRFGEDVAWVLYVDLPQGQVSFHAPDRGMGPEYTGEWCGDHNSTGRVVQFCDSVAEGRAATFARSA